MTILNQALQRPAEEREGFLRAECRGDEELYQEVIEALYWEERMGSFLLEPLLDMATVIRPFAPGQVIAERFEILREIGEGGMGVVYEAHDRKRRQRVAIKAAKPGFQRMLSPELEGALKVRHHNICLVNEIHTEKTEHGEIDFLTMELLEGETLSARLARTGKLKHKEALDIACQLCAGLAEAHQSDIVHRDLKSSNVLLCANEDGSCRAVITDFGLASRADLTAGETGGTPAYMAPELWQGEKATPASDIYALGVILYEMVAGRRPHQQKAEEDDRDVEGLSTLTLRQPGQNADEAPASLMSVSQEEWRKYVTAAMPSRPSAWTKGLDARWDRVIMRCLATAPAERPQKVRKVLGELQREPIRKWPLVTAALLVLLLAAVVGLVRPVRQWVADLIWPPNVRLAVLPYDGPNDLAAIGGGVLQEVAERVQQLRGGRRTVAVIPPSRSAETRTDTPQQARDILHATHALKVAVRREAGGELSVQAVVINLNSQLPMTEFTVRYPRNNLGAMPTALTGLVRMAFRLQESSSEDKLSQAASEPYLNGIYFLNRDTNSFDEAITRFQQAARLDPNSALPAAGMSLALVQKFDSTKQKIYLEQAQEFVHTAQSRNPDSVRVLLASGRVSEKTSQYLNALQDYRRIMELEPRNVDALLGLASTYESLRDPEEAVKALRKAQELDPEYYRPYHLLGIFYDRHGRYLEAAEQFRKMMGRAPGLPDSYFALGAALTELERYKEAEEALQASINIRETAEGLNNLGAIRYFQGRHEEAAAYQKRALRYGPNNYLWLTNVADNLRLARHRTEALSYYRRAREQAKLELTLNPQSGRARAYFAYACARLGYKQRATDEISQAMSILPGDNQVLDWALEIYELLGERNLAIDAFRGLTLATSRQLTHDPDLADFFQDSRVKQQMIDKGGQ
jgi:tetratricopeptide (TPR) repeat protein